jgi:hypothetical protein
MPDILRLRYIGAAPATVPALGKTVEPDHLVEVPGRLVDGGADDCFLAETGNPPQLRAWPLSTWRNETPVKKTTAKE